jgi:hypothetical protein
VGTKRRAQSTHLLAAKQVSENVAIRLRDGQRRLRGNTYEGNEASTLNRTFMRTFEYISARIMNFKREAGEAEPAAMSVDHSLTPIKMKSILPLISPATAKRANRVVTVVGTVRRAGRDRLGPLACCPSI